MKLFKPMFMLLICAAALSLTANAGNKKNAKKAPIDGGITLLIVAGTALGAKKVFGQSKKNISDSEK